MKETGRKTSADRDTNRRHAWRAAFEGHAAVIELLEAELKDEIGVSLTEYDVLLHLAERPPPVRMHELAEAVVISKSGLTRVVDRMEREGLLTRTAIPGDRRSTAIGLTDAGQAMFRDARTVHRRGIRRHFTKHLTEEEAQVVTAVFARARDAALAERRSRPGANGR